MATEERPKDPQRSSKPSSEPMHVLMREILEALKELKAQPRLDPRDRKTETISVLRSALTVHEEIASQRKVCQEDTRQTIALQLDLFHANHIKLMLIDIGLLRKDIGLLCSDAQTTVGVIKKGYDTTTTSFSTVQQTLQGLCSAVFGKKNDKGEVETDGIETTVRSLDKWRTEQEDRRKLAEAKKSDFRYYLSMFMKFVYWLGPFVISTVSAYVAWKATGTP